jgi:glycyl-tRNA synthetase beta chain
LPDEKGYIKAGNEKVINARLSDAQFFWEKNKKQNLIKQVIKLKTLSFYNQLGSMYDKTQRLKKLGSLISEHLNLSKEKIEVAASICKADLVSDLVGEYPELQGVMGKYFAQAQGFDEDISLAISDHYLPIGINSLVSKKPISCAVALADKLDTLVGFFGINEKPTSSKDPFALRRCAIGLLKTIIENNLAIRLKELINYSMLLYSEQNFKLTNSRTPQDLLTFLKERIKNILKDKKIRNDIIEASISLHAGDDFISLYKKSLVFNKYISNDIGKNIIGTYKRASNILDQEQKKQKEKIVGLPDSILFKKQEEKIFFEKINEIRKYFSTNLKKEDYTHTLQILAEAKNTTDNFFDNVIVNDDNSDIKKNRLELLQMFCMTYNNFIDFSKVEGV